MNQPAQEQIKEVWEWCGLTHKITEDWNEYGYKVNVSAWHNGTDLIGIWDEDDSPAPTLDNLFKYAIPKLYKELGHDKLNLILTNWIYKYNYLNDAKGDAADLLFKDIYEVIHQEVKQ